MSVLMYRYLWAVHIGMRTGAHTAKGVKVDGSQPNYNFRRYLVCLKYWTLTLIVCSKVLFPQNFIIKGSQWPQSI